MGNFPSDHLSEVSFFAVSSLLILGKQDYKPTIPEFPLSLHPKAQNLMIFHVVQEVVKTHDLTISF